MRDDDNIEVNILSEDGGELVIQASEGKEETYYLNPIRTMRLIAEELQVCCGTSSLTFGMPERLPPPLFSVHGEAWLEGGYISVIGESSNKSRVFRIAFKAFDETDVAQREVKAGKFPNLVTVGFSRRDWEIGNDDCWFIECYVSPQILGAIVSAVSAGTLTRLNLGLTLEGIYSDDNWAPPSAGANWFLRPSRSDNSRMSPEMAFGGISVLDIGLSRIDLRAKPEAEVEEEVSIPKPEPEPDLKMQALTVLNANIEKLHGTVKTVGWAIALVLLVLVLK